MEGADPPVDVSSSGHPLYARRGDEMTHKPRFKSYFCCSPLAYARSPFWTTRGAEEGEGVVLSLSSLRPFLLLQLKEGLKKG